MARNFNGTSDVLKTSVGTPMNVAFGTFAAIVNVTSFSATRSIMRLATTTPTNVLGFSVNTSGQIILTDGASAPTGTATTLVASEWYLIAAGKATGTTTPRYHIYRYSTDTWVHENAVGTVGNATVPGTSGRMNLMARAADQFTPGDMAVAGFWSRLLSDAEVEQLPFSLQGWYATAPTGLWVLDQGATTQNVPDLSGNGGNQASLTGTTVSTNSVPVFGYGADVVKPYAIPPNVSNIVFRALGTTSKVASGNMSPGLPAGTAQNDILILVTSQQDNVSCSVTGYTQVSAVNNSANCRQEIWIKRAGASESAPTVTHTSGGVSNAVIAAYSGVDTGLTLSVGAGGVIRDLQTASSAAASPTCTGPALTGVVLYDELIFAGMFTVNDTSGATTNNWTTVSGMTEERDDCSSLAGAWGTSFAIDDVRAAGSAGAVTSTIGYLGTLTTMRNIGCQLALSSTVSGGGGSTQNLTVSGAVTPTGSIARQANVVKVGGLTPTGALGRLASKVVAGGLTPSGVSVRTAAKVFAGTVTDAGALVRTASKVTAGAVTPSGALVKLVSLARSGGLTPSGTIAKTAQKRYAGGITLAGALVNTSTRFVALAGSLAPSGALVRQARKVATGSLAPTGVLVRLVSHAFSGGLTPAGVLARTARKVFAGTVTSAGALVKRVGKILSGLISSAGALVAPFGGAPAPDIDGPTQVTLATSGVRLAVLTTSGLRAATTTANGVRQATITARGERHATTTATGIRMTTTSHTGERSATTTHSGTRTAVLTH